MKILFFNVNECGNLEQCKQVANCIVVTEQNKDEIISILDASGMKIYNGTNKYYKGVKELTRYFDKKLKVKNKYEVRIQNRKNKTN